MQGSLTNLFNHNSVVTYSLKNQIKTIIFLSGISLSLISCGAGAGAGAGGLPPNPEPVGKVQGTAFIGAVNEGEVNIYEFKSGVREASLAKTNINVTDVGAYSVDLQTSSKSIMVCLSKVSWVTETLGKHRQCQLAYLNLLPPKKEC